LKFSDKDGLRGTRIGVVRQLFTGPDTDPGIRQLLENALADMKRQAAEIVDGVNIPEKRVRCEPISPAGGAERLKRKTTNTNARAVHRSAVATVSSRRGWEERGGSRSRSRYEDDDDDRRGSRGHGGWLAGSASVSNRTGTFIRPLGR
jgi:Asp-tRNA(Asn)/Glu-tRNA(Gln) amidotransferase A subunit family amidase